MFVTVGTCGPNTFAVLNASSPAGAVQTGAIRVS
jgi:hypothetical protein